MDHCETFWIRNSLPGTIGAPADMRTSLAGRWELSRIVRKRMSDRVVTAGLRTPAARQVKEYQ